MKIAFGICSLGIGHATRSFPIIKDMIKKENEVVIISHGRALSLLKKEFPNLKFYDIPDYPIKYTEKAHQFIPYMLANSSKIIKNMLKSHKFFLDIDKRENFDLIISDSRYDVFNYHKDSYLIIHQLRIMLKMAFLRGGTMFYNSYLSKYFKKILVPDFEENSLSGELSHNLKFINKDKIEYIGPLSPFKRVSMKKDLDLLISISGPEPQRTIFEKKVMKEIGNMEGNIVITLGRPEVERREEKLKIYPYLSFKRREEIMNRSKLIISRPGYSTIMDLYFIGGKAMFIPTPGQPEQEYLARYMKRRKIAGFMSQDNMDIEKMIKESENYEGFRGEYEIRKTLNRFWSVVS